MSNLRANINGTTIRTGKNCPQWLEDMLVELAMKHPEKLQADPAKAVAERMKDSRSVSTVREVMP